MLLITEREIRGIKKKGVNIKIRGRIIEGLRVASTFTQIPWVRKQFIQKLNIAPYPGTLNLEMVDLEDSENFPELKSTPGVEIIPEDSSFCSAQCYPVLIFLIAATGSYVDGLLFIAGLGIIGAGGTAVLAIQRY